MTNFMCHLALSGPKRAWYVPNEVFSEPKSDKVKTKRGYCDYDWFYYYCLVHSAVFFTSSETSLHLSFDF